MFVILVIFKIHFKRKINTLRTNRKKEEESPISHQVMYQFYRQQNRLQFSFVYLTFHLY